MCPRKKNAKFHWDFEIQLDLPISTTNTKKNPDLALIKRKKGQIILKISPFSWATDVKYKKQSKKISKYFNFSN